MSINAAAGSKLYIGGTTAAANLTAFEALTWTAVGEIEDLGEFGDQSEAISFTSLNDSRVRKLKGPRDAGTMNLTVGDDMSDAGQTALEAAEASHLDYNFKVELNDAVTIGGENSKHYFRGKVMSKRRNVGNATNVVRRSFTIGINTAIISSDPD